MLQRALPKWIHSVNMLVYIVATYFVSIQKIGEANTTIASGLIMLASFVVLVYDVCASYKTNGLWIIWNFCVVSCSMFVLLEISGICSPGRYWRAKVTVIYGGILTMKLMFDLGRRLCGLDLD
jgi:Na+-translocating ferredoxin:NAD+ oxidoreductase RnfD subunit